MEEVLSEHIVSYLHCKLCVEELPKETSPRDYINIEIAINLDNQMLLGCVRHGEHVGAFTLKEDYTPELIGQGCDCHE
tara:strand:- start:99 stop:332 length:234 start_codon:yes stop_codon:yes gene_type:complete